MTAQSNAFQSLIVLIEKQLAPVGTAVVESHLMPDPDTGDAREVDVALTDVETGVILVAIECRDHNRSATVAWMDQIAGKYKATVPRLVTVNTRGYAKAALKKAAANGITALTLASAQDADWTSYVAAKPSVTVEIRSMLYVALANINLVDKRMQTGDLGAIREDSVRFFLRSGEQLGTAWQIFQKVSASHPDFEARVRTLPVNDQGLHEWRLGMPPGAYAVIKKRKLMVEGILVLLRLSIEHRVMPWDAQALGRENVATALATAQEGELLLATAERTKETFGLTWRRSRGKWREGSRFTLYGQSDTASDTAGV